MTLDGWMKSGKYLPPAMRDFHDQKDIFKAIHDLVNVEGHSYARDVGWVAGQCYVIDIFLWFMARRGYTLQRSRKRFEFEDLNQDVSDAKKRRNATMASVLFPSEQRGSDA